MDSARTSESPWADLVNALGLNFSLVSTDFIFHVVSIQTVIFKETQRNGCTSPTEQ